MPACIRQFAIKSILTKVFHTHINVTLARELILDDLVGRSRRSQRFRKYRHYRYMLSKNQRDIEQSVTLAIQMYLKVAVAPAT